MRSTRLHVLFVIFVPGALLEARRFTEEEIGRSNKVADALQSQWFLKGDKKYLKKLTRYGNLDDEEQFPLLVPRATRLTRRTEACKDFDCKAEDPRVKPRLASPFEHVCGGARGKREPRKGHDGPTQWLSFSNADTYPEVREDCNMTWDIGQRRMIVQERDVLKRGGLVVDLSTPKKAFEWCYKGGNKTTITGKNYSFQGARDIKPWRFKCAIIAFKNYTGSSYTPRGSRESISARWWDQPGSRELVADRCKKWALDSKEVLVLPNPEKIEQGIPNNEVIVDNDRDPADYMCTEGLQDRCVSFDRATKTVQCSGARRRGVW